MGQLRVEQHLAQLARYGVWVFFRFSTVGAFLMTILVGKFFFKKGERDIWQSVYCGDTAFDCHIFVFIGSPYHLVFRFDHSTHGFFFTFSFFFTVYLFTLAHQNTLTLYCNNHRIVFLVTSLTRFFFSSLVSLEPVFSQFKIKLFGVLFYTKMNASF